MAIEFANRLTITDEGDGIVRTFSDPNERIEGSMILGFDPFKLDGIVDEVYGLEVHLVRDERQITPVLLSAANRSKLIASIESDAGAAKLLHLALQNMIEFTKEGK